MAEPLLQGELAHPALTEMHVVGSMHERKALLASLAEGFIALPGGLGTLEEILEALTWAQLGIHRKPVGLLNVAGYWNGLLRMLSHAVREGFVRPEHAKLLFSAETPADMLTRLAAWSPPRVSRVWLGPTQI